MRANLSRLLFLAFVLVAASAGNCDPPPLPPTRPAVSLTLIPDTFNLNVGQERLLVAVVSGTTNQAVNWSTSNASVASVSTTGLVRAVAPGTSVIEAVSVVDQGARDASTVNVARPTDTPPL